MKSWQSRSESETREIGRRLAALLEPDGTLLLSGDLGAGKTVLAQGIAAGLGIDPLEVQSPTFTLMREHRLSEHQVSEHQVSEQQGSSGRLLHVDLYRLEPADVEAVGLEEQLQGPGVKVVEWAERIPFPVPKAIRLVMNILAEGNVREIVRLDEPEQDDNDEQAAGKPAAQGRSR